MCASSHGGSVIPLITVSFVQWVDEDELSTHQNRAGTISAVAENLSRENGAINLMQVTLD